VARFFGGWGAAALGTQCVGVAQGAVRARLSAGEAIGDLVPKAVEGDAQAPCRDLLPQGRLPASAACTRPDPPSLLLPSHHRYPSTSGPPPGRLPVPVFALACLVLTRPSSGARCSVVRRICCIPDPTPWGGSESQDQEGTGPDFLLNFSALFCHNHHQYFQVCVYPHTLGAKSKTPLPRAAFDLPTPERRGFFPLLHIIPDQIACGPTGPRSVTGDADPIVRPHTDPPPLVPGPGPDGRDPLLPAG